MVHLRKIKVRIVSMGARVAEVANINVKAVMSEQYDTTRMMADGRGNNTNFTFKDVEEYFERFSGDDHKDVRKWLREIEDTSELLGWNDIQKLIYSRRLLSGSAKLFISSEGLVREWQEFKYLLIDEFGVTVNSAIVHKQLMTRVKRENETFRQYVYAMVDIASQARIEDEALVSYVIDGIRDTAVKKTVLYEATTIAELKERLKVYERMKQRDTGRFSGSRAASLVPPSSVVPKVNTDDRNQRKCFKCGKDGHQKKDCPNMKCYNCQELGHLSVNCPKKSETPKVNMVSLSKVMKEVRIGGKSISAVCDSESQITCINMRTYLMLAMNHELSRSVGHVQGIGKVNVEVIGEFCADIEIDGDFFSEKVLVLDNKVMDMAWP